VTTNAGAGKAISKTNHRSDAQSVHAVAVYKYELLLTWSCPLASSTRSTSWCSQKAHPLIMLSSGCRNLGSCEYKGPQQEKEKRVQNTRERNLKRTVSGVSLHPILYW